MLIYADDGDLETWTGQPAPDNATQLLREASILVGIACQADRYTPLPSGLPADDDKRDAMRDAACAQVEAWTAASVDPIAGPGGQEPRMTVSAIDGASVSFDAYLTAADRANAIKYLSASAYRLLRLSGLASSWVQS